MKFLLRGTLLTGLIVFAATASRPAQGDLVNTLALVKANLQINQIWQQHGKPMVEAALDDQLAGLVGLNYTTGGTQVQVLQLLDTQYWIDLPPGFQKLTMQEVRLRLPVLGFWALQAKVKIKVTQSLGWFSFSTTFDVTIVAFNVWAKAKVLINSADPEAPQIASVPAPEVSANVVFWTSNWLLNILVPFLTPYVNNLIEDGIAEAIDQVAPMLGGLAGMPGTPFGTGGPAVVDSGAPTDFLSPALAISQNIQDYHLPYGTLVETSFSNPYTGTWAESLDDPTYDPGTVTGYGGWGDSAIWSGHYLSAEAFRAKVTGSPDAVANAMVVLNGIDQLTQMIGIPGRLNRSVRPADLYPPGADSDDVVLPYNGTNYVMSNFISRDQYMGVFMGCATAYDFIDNAAAKALAKANIERMLDYLLDNHWVAYRLDGEISTLWHFNYAQMCAWMHAGFRVNPSKYWLQMVQHLPLEDLAWVGPWLETFDAVKNSYYKFNLQHGAFYTLLRLETIPTLWNRVWKGFRIVRKALAHHQNAHFNMCEVGAMPSLANGPMGGETRELLRLWLQRYRRDISHDTWNDPSIEKVWYAPLSTGALLGGGDEAAWDTEEAGWVAAHPIPVPLRGATDFLWQRGPFGLSNGGGSPNAESPGVDYLLPYWMGRYYGVFSN